MKLKFLLGTILLLLASTSLFSQVKSIHPPVVDAPRYVNHGTRIENPSPPVWLDPKTVSLQKNWEVTLSQHGINHGSDFAKNLIDSIKLEGRKMRQAQARDSFYLVPEDEWQEGQFMSTVTPYLNNSFKGNRFNGWQPPDNSLAVSDEGFIVSVINSSILFSNVNGDITLDENFDDFFSNLNLSGGYFDPKVLYDPVEEKFILVVLNGNTPATSQVVVSFSKTSNPNEGWFIYRFEGDPAGLGLWFDYPSIGISIDDIYISGNLYTADGNFSQTLLYMIGKAPAFHGQDVAGVHFYDIRDAHGLTDFGIVPVSYGFDDSVSPGLNLVSTEIAGGTEVTMYWTDNNAANNPSIWAYSATIPNYYTPFNGIMPGTTDEINTNDCRTLTAFYAADGTIHFAFNTRGDDFHTKLYYCRLNAGDLTSTSIKIGLQPYEYAFPTLAPFTTTDADKSVLIGFLRTSGSTYPEFRMITLDNDMNFNESHLIKAGETFVDFHAGTIERWGDYTGISRRHNANNPEIWLSGCYAESDENGRSNILCTWIGQVTDQQVNAPPTSNFIANTTEILAGQSVEFTDQSTNIPTAWSWSFPGGTPSTSNQPDPVVTYPNAGQYDVRLEATNAFGSGIEIKIGYITVQGQAEVPVADFTSDITNVPAGGVVKFQDLSSNNPTEWEWFFLGGTPTVSNEQNPIVVYTEPGCHDVTLIAYNAAGTNVITKPCYIDVLTAVTDADTTFDKFLVYPNPVSNEHLNVDFETSRPLELNFIIADESGRLIKNLIERRVKGGNNNLAFSTEPLAPGIYYLLVYDQRHSLIKSEKFIVL